MILGFWIKLRCSTMYGYSWDKALANWEMVDFNGDLWDDTTGSRTDISYMTLLCVSFLSFG